MNIEQCENRNQAVIQNALNWAKGEKCNPLEQLDVAILGEYLSLRIPKCFDKFVYSESKNQAKVYGPEKTVFKTLDRIANKLIAIQTNKNSWIAKQEV